VRLLKISWSDLSKSTEKKLDGLYALSLNGIKELVEQGLEEPTIIQFVGHTMGGKFTGTTSTISTTLLETLLESKPNLQAIITSQLYHNPDASKSIKTTANVPVFVLKEKKDTKDLNASSAALCEHIALGRIVDNFKNICFIKK
jgi:hypothetical protein